MPTWAYPSLGLSVAQHQEPPMHTPILIAGAGPTGLNLALALARRNIPFRILSEAAGPGEHSRAMVVQARTLEFYDQLGFAHEMVREGIVLETLHIRGGDHAREITSTRFSDLGEDISPYPFALAYPQDDHERFLLQKLTEAGGRVEWQSKLLDFTQSESAIHARISHNGQIEETEADYICGCDGAHSAVRQSLHLGFPGGTYDQLFYVADVQINRPPDRDLYINLGGHILTLMFPVRASGMQRLIGLVPSDLSARQGLTFEDIRPFVEPQLDVKCIDINWFSTYRVHHRVAETFRVGRAFLLGDAGHIHSPAGGQGMNTGIGDAVNLAWKLAHVIQGRAAPSLLDTYDPERIAFARALVATTDRAFTAIVNEGVSGELTRRILVPLVFSVAVRFAPSRHAMFRLLSQARIHYPDSPLSRGKAGHVHGGDRLPWLAQGRDNFAPLRSLDWQMHVYGDIKEPLQSICRALHLPLHHFEWSDAAHHAGFAKDAALLIRPDGHVALALPSQNPEDLTTYIHDFALQFRNP